MIPLYIELYRRIISSLELANHFQRGEGFPFLMIPALDSLLMTLSIGAVILRVLLSLIKYPLFFLPYVVVLDLNMLVPKK